MLLETFLGGLVEIVLFMVLLKRSPSHADPSQESGHSLIPVIRAAILGSILANLLLCLGFCFFVGGLRSEEQEFHEVVSEVGTGLLLVAGFGLLIPSAYYHSLQNSGFAQLQANEIHISQICAVIMIFAYLLYVWFQMRTHHGLYDEVLEADEQKDHDREKDLKKDKLTLTECVIALVIAIACVSLHAVFLGKPVQSRFRESSEY